VVGRLATAGAHGLGVLQDLADGGPHGRRVDDRVASRIMGEGEAGRRQADRCAIPQIR
jgi:hypothetical protein